MASKDVMLNLEIQCDGGVYTMSCFDRPKYKKNAFKPFSWLLPHLQIPRHWIIVSHILILVLLTTLNRNAVNFSVAMQWGCACTAWVN